MARKVHEIAFAINGKLSNSFKGTFGAASDKVKTLQKQISDLNLQFKTGAIAVDKYQKEYQKLIRQMQKAESIRPAGGGQLGGVMGRVGGAAALGVGAGAAAAGFFTGQGLRKSMEFEAQLSSIQALTGLTGEEMDNMRRLSLKMGSQTKYSALESARAIEELVKAGMNPATVSAGGLEAALNLATAGGLELVDAAEIMSDGLNGFRKDGMSAAEAANILAGAANASSTDVMQLKFGLSAVGPVADGIGVSFKEVNATLAAFSNNALKGSDAGTSLKTFLANVQPNTDKAAELFEKYGLSLKDGSKNVFFANGQLKDMAEVAEILQEKFKKLSDQQRSELFFDLFGSDAVRAANILYKEGAEGIEKMYQEMSKVTALDVAKKKMDNAAGAVEQFKGAIETMQIAALEPTLPLVKDLALLFADLAERYTPMLTERFKELTNVFRKYLDPYLNDVSTMKVEGRAELKFKQLEMREPQQKVPTITQTIRVMWDDAVKSFDQWYAAGGKEQILQVSDRMTQILIDSMKLAAPKMLEAASEIGGAMALGIMQGFNESVVDPADWIMGKLGMPTVGDMIKQNKPKEFARGGIVSNPTYGVFGEAGTEALIPLDGSQRAVSLWQQTGRMLGAMDSGSSTQYSFTYAPVIQGGDASAIRAQLQEDQREFERRMTEWAKQQRRVSYRD